MLAVVVVGWLGLASCSGSGDGDDSPTLDRIDGPAEVDPSFDPFATDPSAPAVTDGG